MSQSQLGRHEIKGFTISKRPIDVLSSVPGVGSYNTDNDFLIR
jgi:hypothetical protein